MDTGENISPTKLIPKSLNLPYAELEPIFENLLNDLIICVD